LTIPSDDHGTNSSGWWAMRHIHPNSQISSTVCEALMNVSRQRVMRRTRGRHQLDFEPTQLSCQLDRCHCWACSKGSEFWWSTQSHLRKHTRRVSLNAIGSNYLWYWHHFQCKLLSLVREFCGGMSSQSAGKKTEGSLHQFGHKVNRGISALLSRRKFRVLSMHSQYLSRVEVLSFCSNWSLGRIHSVV